jgi:hypothetical protein
MAKYPIKTICGSMRYYEKMLEVAERETANGVIILMPFVQKGADRPGGNSLEFVEMLDDMHKRKIDMSDAIIVVGTHIGESTQSEIDYAEKTGKAILFWTEHFGAIA